MPKVTIVTGLLASGKSTLMRKIVAETGATHIDHFFTDRSGVMSGQSGFTREKHRELVAGLRAGRDFAIEEIGFCLASNREAFAATLRWEVPGVEITWVFFENDLEKANRNIRHRAAPDLPGQLDLNSGLTRVYTIPAGAKPLPIWQPTS